MLRKKMSKLIMLMVVVLFGLVSLSHGQVQEGKYAEEIKDRRIAVFYEEGFPSKGSKPVEWYKGALVEFGLDVTVVDAKEVSDPQFLTKGKFDTLILPDGYYIPFEATYSILNFLSEGGNIITGKLPSRSLR